MTPDPRKLAISEHQRWLGYLQPEGLVVSPLALVDSQVQLDTGSYAASQERFLDAVSTDPETGRHVIPNFAFFARDFLGWQDKLLSLFSVSAEVPDGLKISTGEHGEILQPDAAYRALHPADPAKPWLLLIRQIESGASLDQVPDAKRDHGWIATPHQKFERLLRETGVPIGILCNGHSIRLCYAPKGENSGAITFPVAFMTEVAGRAVASALDLLLSHRRLNSVPEAVRLPALLRKSRDYQAEVSTTLSNQVLEALFELARGFQSADEKSGHTLLADTWRRDPQEIYGGLITTLLRMVFLLYAEDRGLMPSGDLYQRNYSVQGLFEKLRADHERYPDLMDERYAAWPQLLALFRAVHTGCKHRKMTLPARQGHLFDPDRFPFLEGRAGSPQPAHSEPGRADPPRSAHLSPWGRDANEPATESSSYRNTETPTTETPNLPRLSDGTIHRVLDLLLYLSGERLSYRTLDVEQIGSVYETIMGFEVQKATGRSVALKPKKAHGAPVHLDLDSLLAAKPADREKTLLEQADTKLPDAAAKALKSAATVDDLLAALDKRIDRRATPHPVPAGSIILQPTDERRRSGSHYTPRSFTAPIVRKTLEPVLDRLGRHPLPAAILDLKICDIAVGSAAFLVEVCRQLADELVSSWHFHQCLPVIPPDEDELLYARRLVAQRCLYGVDRNPMAVDLAKLSLWLATMAKDHPFTFLDHAIKCGDSLVGLTNRQIAAFHWDPTQAKDRVFGQEKLEQQIAKVADARKSILDWTEDTEAAVLKKRDFLAAADSAAASLKTTGDLAIAAFFAGEKPKQRQQNRDEFLHRHLELQKGDAQQIPWEVNTLKQLRGGEFPIRPFHWEIEFPEVFTREHPGFDAIVGNPPYLGGTRISHYQGQNYLYYLVDATPGSTGNVDLAAFFVRRVASIIRLYGAFGLITTNSITAGDSGRASIFYLRGGGFDVPEPTPGRQWTGESATVAVIQIFGVHTAITEGKPVIAHRLLVNDQLCSRGSDVFGDGFVLDPNEYYEWKQNHPESLSIIEPYLTGSDFNDSPTHQPSRFIINFGTLSREEAARFTAAFERVEQRVKPARASVAQKDRRELWWLYATRAPRLYEFLQNHGRCVGISQIANHLTFSFADAGQVFSNTILLFLNDTYQFFSTLQSRVHAEWVTSWAGTMGLALRYTSTTCFETFPFPPDWETNEALELAGREYYEYRAALMVRNDEGLTKTYNRFHDPEERSPDIHQLRTLHAAMDRAVLAAYGWPDIPTACEFLLDYEEEEDPEDAPEAPGKKKGKKKKKPYRYRWPDEVRDEVLARLLALNAERAAQERLSGTTGKKSAAKKAAKKKAPSRKDIGLDDLFSLPIQTPALRELPTVPRIIEKDPNIYATALVAALLHEAKGPLPWHRLRDAYILATSPRLMLSHALPDDKDRVAAWKQSWKQPAGPEHLLQAILNLGGRNLAVEKTATGEPVFALQDGALREPDSHTCYDAWLALEISKPLARDIILDIGDFDIKRLNEQILQLVA